jgi:hypothetical protein
MGADLVPPSRVLRDDLMNRHRRLGTGIIFADRHMSPSRSPPGVVVRCMPRVCPWPRNTRHGQPGLHTLGFLISTSTLHILGVLIGEPAMVHAALLTGLRVSGAIVADSGVVFLVRALEGVM